MAVKPRFGLIQGSKKQEKYKIPVKSYEAVTVVEAPNDVSFDHRWNRSKRIKRIAHARSHGYVPNAMVRITDVNSKEVRLGTIIRYFSRTGYKEADPVFSVTVQHADGINRMESHTVYSCDLIKA